MQFLLAYSATQVAHKSVQSLLVLRPCITLGHRAAQVSHYASRSPREHGLQAKLATLTLLPLHSGDKIKACVSRNKV